MKNILFIHNGSDLYGGSRSLLSIISIFSKKEQILSVVLPNKGPLITELNKYNVKVYVIKSLPVVAMNKFGRFKHIIKFLTDKGDIVLDPFMGGGTTAEVALDLGRDYIGFEKNKTYVEELVKSIENKFKSDFWE